MKWANLNCFLRGFASGLALIIALNSLGSVITIQVWPLLPMIEEAPK